MEALRLLDPNYLLAPGMQTPASLPFPVLGFARVGTRSDLDLEWITFSTEIRLRLGPPAARISPTQFWLDQRKELPTLSGLALRLLCLRQGIADVERLFSVLRQLQTPERLLASPETLEKEFFIACNRHVTDKFWNKS